MLRPYYSNRLNTKPIKPLYLNRLNTEPIKYALPSYP